jgi:HK97 family phage portal protein
MGLLTALFKPKPQSQRAVIEINNSFSNFSGNAYGNAAFRAAVDVIGRHTAKLKAHTGNTQLDRLLQSAPNAYMSSYDLLYKVATTYYLSNNAFILIQRTDSGNIDALYPLNPSSVEFQGAQDGALYCKMLFPDGRQAVFPYADIIHLRRHFCNSELLGNDNAPLYPLLDVSHTLTEATTAAAKNATSIKGVLKFTSLVNPQQVKLEKEQFIKDYFNLSNSGGVAATDQRFDFVPTNTTPYSVPHEQVDAINRQIYSYLGVSPKIVTGDYNENEFSAFFESVIEPFALQMSLEFSNKCGVDVSFSSERLEFSSAATKIKLLHEAAPLGLLTLNEARKLLALPPVPDGDRRLQSLNYVAADKAGIYQEIQEDENGKAQL